MKIFSSFQSVMANIDNKFRFAPVVENKRWQSMDVSTKPEMAMHELFDYSFKVRMPSEDLDYYREDIRPNVPWADDHFEQERASGHPINPGETWKRWPWGQSASKFLVDGKFSHSYAERYWPRFANAPDDGWKGMDEFPRRGIRFAYGDLFDVVNLLKDDPNTRQAVLPVWFPEDTGVVHKERVPCTISYVFNHRGGFLHVFYHIRSCDFIRHFQDDCYLTVRLLLWILGALRDCDENWKTVQPGWFSMHINSLHMFVNDHRGRYSK